jgi:hypothetical protein
MEEGPRNGEVAGRVTGSKTAEVDNARQAIRFDQQVARRDIAMHPARPGRRARGQGLFPGANGKLGLGLSKPRDRLAGLGVIDSEAAATMEVVLARRGTAAASIACSARRKPISASASPSTSRIDTLLSGAPGNQR